MGLGFRVCGLGLRVWRAGGSNSAVVSGTQKILSEFTVWCFGSILGLLF